MVAVLTDAKVLPNKRLQLTGPALKGGVRLCPDKLVPQGGALAPARRPPRSLRAIR